MIGTHLFSDLKNPHIIETDHNGQVIKCSTRYGKNTINYWALCPNNKYINYDCKTI